MLSPVRLSICLSVTRVDQSTRSQAVAMIADRSAKNCRGHVILGHAHFQGIVRPLGIPDAKLQTKFEVSSSSSFRDIAL